MKFSFFVFFLLLSLSARAEECTAVSIVDPEAETFEACRITVEWSVDQEPLFRLKRPHEITEVQCRTYCQDFTLIPILWRGETVIGEVQKALIDLFLEAHAGDYTDLTRQVFLSTRIAALVQQYSQTDETLDRVIVRSLESTVRERNPNVILNRIYYTPVTDQDLSENEKSSDPEGILKCSICMEPIIEQLRAGSEVVRVNCGNSNGGDIFCKDCIKDFYQYDQRCPNCRGEIAPLP